MDAEPPAKKQRLDVSLPQAVLNRSARGWVDPAYWDDAERESAVAVLVFVLFKARRPGGAHVDIGGCADHDLGRFRLWM